MFRIGSYDLSVIKDIFYKKKVQIAEKTPCVQVVYLNRGVARGEAGGPRNLADQLTLFKPGWEDFAPHTTASPIGFKKLSTPL